MLARELKALQKGLADLPVKRRFHTKKARRRALYFARHANSKARKRKREVKKKYKELIAQARWITEVSEQIRSHLRTGSPEAQLLAHYEELTRRVIYQTEKRILEGIILPATEADQLSKLRVDISTVSIRKKGRKTEEEQEAENSEAFKDGQRFRAGIEGTISVLKRGYKLNRCLLQDLRTMP